MKRTGHNSKLSLNKETLRALHSSQLEQVGGASGGWGICVSNVVRCSAKTDCALACLKTAGCTIGCPTGTQGP